MSMKDLDKESIDFINELEINLVDESEARQSYFKLLKIMENNRRIFDHEIYEKYKNDIEEIVSEELKHSVMLHAMMEEISGIKPEK